MIRIGCWTLALALLGCGDDGATGDAGTDAGRAVDAGRPGDGGADAGRDASRDASSPTDASADTGPADAGATGPRDAGPFDPDGPSDPFATPATRAVYARLREVQAMPAFLLGQQHDGWSSRARVAVGGGDEPWRPGAATDADWAIFRSDVEITTAALADTDTMRAAVSGFNMQQALALGAAGRARYVERIVEAHRAGALVTLHWPVDNPVVRSEPERFEIVPDDKHRNGSNNDPRGEPVQRLLEPGSTIWAGFWMDRIREIKRLLREVAAANGGEPVPILFRPLHEMLGGAQWWSIDNVGIADPCEDDAYVRLYRRTVDALRADETHGGELHAGVHSLLMVFSPQRPADFPVDHGCLYPGPAHTDVVGLDIYERVPADFEAGILPNLRATVELAERWNEVAAITEFGPKDGFPEDTSGPEWDSWYLARFLRPLRGSDLLDRFAYAMAWSNTEGSWWFPLSAFDHAAGGARRFYGATDPQLGFRALVRGDETLLLPGRAAP